MYQQNPPYAPPNFGAPNSLGYPPEQGPNYPFGQGSNYQSGQISNYPPEQMSGYPPGTAYPPGSTPGYPPQVSPGGPAPGYPGSTPGYPPQVSPGGPAPGYPPQVSPGGQQPAVCPPGPGFLPEPGPTAPSLNQVEKVQGYEHVTFEEAIIQPPTAPGWQDEPEPERKEIAYVPQLTDDDIQAAVATYASQHCCYGKKVAQDMVVNGVVKSSAFRYTLQTFGETRESAWRFEPYNGQPIDGPMNGPAPGPWDIFVKPTEEFSDSKQKMEVPHTAFVKQCHTCLGNCRVRCSECLGMAVKNCTWCNGSGRRFDDSCSSCSGSGRSRCTHCTGTGQVKCDTCKGKGQLKGFVELVITWTNHYEDYISSETSSLPKDKIRKVTGDIVFNEERPRVWPITNSGDESVNRASQDLVTKHQTSFPNERILKQRHELSIIPVARVDYTFQDKKDVFYVYGFEDKCYFEKYPQNCCWGCTIL